MTKIIEDISAKQIKDTPKFSSGDTVVVSVKVKEGKRERIQAFEGVVVAVKNRGISSSFTVRKISYGCLLYTSPSPRDLSTSRMPSSA